MNNVLRTYIKIVYVHIILCTRTAYYYNSQFCMLYGGHMQYA